MSSLIGCHFFLLICITQVPIKLIKGDNAWYEIYDTNGNPTSLLYDGGYLIFICDYDSISSTENRSLIIKNDQLDAKKMILADVNQSEIRYNQSINHRILNATFSCSHGSRSVRSITINHILCNPTIMPPLDCLEPKEHCQITSGDSAVCSKLKRDDCLEMSIISSWQKFYYVIGSPSTSNGLCRALSECHESDVNLVSTTFSGLPLHLQFYLVANNLHKRQLLYMNRWLYIDRKYPYQIYAANSKYRRGSSDDPDLLTVNATVDGVVVSSFNITNLTISGEENITNGKENSIRSTTTITINLTLLVHDLKQQKKPAKAYITCSGFDSNHKAIFRYSGQLMVFDSHRDLHSGITEENVGTVGDESIRKLHIKVTAAKGLYICVKKGKDKCVPTVPSNSDSLEVIVAVKQGNHNVVTTFYIGVFASSPHKRYVLVHDRLAKHTITHDRKTVKSHVPGHSPDLNLTVGVPIFAVISLILVVVIVVIAVLWTRSTRKYEEEVKVAEHSVKRELAVHRPRPKTSLGASHTEFFTIRKSSIQSSTWD